MDKIIMNVDKRWQMDKNKIFREKWVIRRERKSDGKRFFKRRLWFRK